MGVVHFEIETPTNMTTTYEPTQFKNLSKNFKIKFPGNWTKL